MIWRKIRQKSWKKSCPKNSVKSQCQYLFVKINEKIRENVEGENWNWKTRQNAENKQTFGLTGKIEINEKTRQNVENKQTWT